MAALDGQCRHWIDARNGATTSAEFVPADHLHQQIMQLLVLRPQRLPRPPPAVRYAVFKPVTRTSWRTAG